MDYFAPARFDPKDHINERLWATSVTIQRAIQEPRDVASPDDIGAQQAMLRGDSVLPWVPDIVGSQWRHRDALLVVGTAYAGFISEFSGRHQKNTIALSKYYDLASQPVGIFQTQFLETVVSGDYAFYDPVADLLEGLVDPVKVALFDLCRASFVRRGHGYERRIDSSKETQRSIPNMWNGLPIQSTRNSGLAHGHGRGFAIRRQNASLLLAAWRSTEYSEH